MVHAQHGIVPWSAAPTDEPFSLNTEYVNDADPHKVNLGIGVYRTDEGLPWPLPVVEEVEKHLASAKDLTRHEYLPLQGDRKFLELARDLAFDLVPGSKPAYSIRSRTVSVQTVSGTGANHIGADYLSRILGPQRVWLPDPTWSNHTVIWNLVGVEIRTYPYYDEARKKFNYDGVIQILNAEAQPGDIVLLHACAHNPTGSDPSKREWTVLAELCRSRRLFPFFDLAYQGFASGNLSEDVWAIKLFASEPNVEFCVAQSFSKNFGLYGQRAGALHFVLRAESVTSHDIVLSHLCHLARGQYSMAPRAGSDIVGFTLQNPTFREQWQKDLTSMSGRIKAMRQVLLDELTRLGTPGTWDHIIQQIGMFSYTGLSKSQVLAVRERHHVYMLYSGRISISGLTMKNVSYVARAFDDVVRTVL